MQILEPPSESFSLVFTCSRCGAKLQAEAGDVQIGQFGVRDEVEIRHYVECPCCAGPHFLDSHSIPPIIRDRLSNSHSNRKTAE